MIILLESETTMTNQIYVMSGVTGSGKTTYIQRNLGDITVFSADIYSRQLFNHYAKDNSNKEHDVVFNAIMRDVRVVLKENDNVMIAIDANHLVRKQRRNIYENISRYGKIKVLFFYEPLKELQRRSPDVLVESLRLQYVSLQVPRIGVDCDEFEVISSSTNFTSHDDSGVNFLAEFKFMTSPILYEELALNFVSHDSKFHQESVDEHIHLAIKSAPNEQMAHIARFHDLGKALNKSFDSNQQARFSGHANLGAVYWLVFKYQGITVYRNDLIAEVIHQHMNQLMNSISKAKRLDKLTYEELDALAQFAEIDDLATQRPF